MISYAQNFEDVMLWRALSEVKNGFYIDIGAQDPVVDSISLAFYENGWTGVHVEPTPHYADLLRKSRPRDITIQAAVSDGPSILKFFEIPNSGISTADPVIAQRHRSQGFEVQEITVPSVSLSSIFEICGDRDIHWLKIDVEGFEQQVIESWGQSTAHPWIILVESTLPLSREETHQNWESSLLEHGYSKAHFDGLNCYYVSDTQPHLKAYFRSPPNVFDGFNLSGTSSASFHQLIERQHQEKLALGMEEYRQGQDQAKIEIESFAQDLAAIQETHRKREQDLSNTIDTVRYELTGLLRKQIEREREFATQLREAENAATTEKNDIARDLGHQLQSLKDLNDENQQASSAQIAQLRDELACMLQDQAQREKEFSAALRDLQMASAAEKEIILSDFKQQINDIQAFHVERERAAAEVTGRVRHELTTILRQQAQREREFAATLRDTQQSAYNERESLTLFYSQETQILTDLHVEREQKLVDEHRDAVRRKEDAIERLNGHVVALTQASTTLQIEIAALRNSTSWRVTAPVRWFSRLLKKGAPPQKPFIPADSASDPRLPPSPTSKTAPDPNPYVSISEQPGMTDAPPPLVTLPGTIRAASSLKELMRYNDSHFVNCAYLTLLKRHPDEGGRAYYLSLLRTGVAKIQVLGQISYSQEARNARVRLQGLDNAILLNKLARIPIVGFLVQAFTGAEGVSKSQVRLRAIEQNLAMISDKSDFYARQLGKHMEELRALIRAGNENVSNPEINRDQAANKAGESSFEITPDTESQYNINPLDAFDTHARTANHLAIGRSDVDRSAAHSSTLTATKLWSLGERKNG